MLLLYAAVILAVDMCCNAGEVPICDCSQEGSSVKITRVWVEGYPPMETDTDKIATFRFQVSKPTSADLMLSVTANFTYQCENGTVYNEIETCSNETPFHCIHFKEGKCKKIDLELVIPILKITLLKKTSSCQDLLFPGSYEVTTIIGGVDLECNIISGDFKFIIMADGKEVGCYTSKPTYVCV